MTQYFYSLIFLGFFTLSVVQPGECVAATAPLDQTENQEKMFSVIDKYARFANVAYEEKADMRQLSKHWNYSLTDAGQLEGLEVRYFLATNDRDKTQIIAIRGTSNVENAIVNIALQLNQDNPADVPLHNGFSQTALALFNALNGHIKREYSISVTGHSLGGGVAVVLAMYLDIAKYSIDKVVTFGQPKVTNIRGADRFSHLNILRVVTPKDVIPLLPPFDPVDVANMDIYWHLGTEIVLLGGDEYSVLGGINSMLRTTKFLNAQPDEDNVRNHEMSFYLRLVNQKRSSATLIPYKNDFSFMGNILKLFD